MPWIQVRQWIAKCDYCSKLLSEEVDDEEKTGLPPYDSVIYFDDKTQPSTMMVTDWVWVEANDKIYCGDCYGSQFPA